MTPGFNNALSRLRTLGSWRAWRVPARGGSPMTRAPQKRTPRAGTRGVQRSVWEVNPLGGLECES